MKMKDVLHPLMFCLVVSLLTIVICIWNVAAAQAASPTSPTSPTNVEPELNPMEVRYTGKVVGEEAFQSLETWIVTDKATGARILLVENFHNNIACAPLPPIPPTK